MDDKPIIGADILACGVGRFATILADPPWPISVNKAMRTGRADRFHYHTLPVSRIAAMPVEKLALRRAHLYLWAVNSLVAEGVEVMRRWGFAYKTHLVWCKTRKDGGVDGSGVGNYFRHASELVLFGVRGSLPTRAPARRQVNVIKAHRREHSRKPDDLYAIIEGCSPPPRLELFARYPRAGWHQWGNQLSLQMQTSFDAPGGPTTLARTSSWRFVILRPKRKRR